MDFDQALDKNDLCRATQILRSSLDTKKNKETKARLILERFISCTEENKIKKELIEQYLPSFMKSMAIV